MIGQALKAVRTCVIEFCKSHQYLCGNIPFPGKKTVKTWRYEKSRPPHFVSVYFYFTGAITGYVGGCVFLQEMQKTARICRKPMQKQNISLSKGAWPSSTMVHRNCIGSLRIVCFVCIGEGSGCGGVVEQVIDPGG